MKFLLVYCIIYTGFSLNNNTPGDYPIISDTLAAASPSSNPVKRLDFIREVSYGETDEVFLGRISAVTADHRNRVFMADLDQSNIHVYNPDGSYLTSLGRHGQGPGEFNQMSMHMNMSVHSNRLMATDVMGLIYHKINVYSLEDLSYHKSVNLIPDNQGSFNELDGFIPYQVYPRSDGYFLVKYQRRETREEDLYPFFLQDSSGTIFTGPIFEQKSPTYLTHIAHNYTRLFSFPFYEKSLFAVSSDDHLYSARTNEFKIYVHDPGGKFVRAFQYPFENKQLDRSRIIDQYEGYSRQMIREARDLPDTWPAMNSMFFDDENRLWVSTFVDDDEIYEWWVLKNTGDVIARFEWPRTKRVELVNNGYLYTRETEKETGLVEIVRYRIEMDGK